MIQRRLIITADDLGASAAINRGIGDGVGAGIVSAVSVLANGPAVHTAMGVLTRHVAVGVHLNLTENDAVAPLGEVHSLVRADGRFFPLGMLLLRATLGLVRAAHVAHEAAAQIERLRTLGYPLVYADSHQHVHVHPRLAGPIAQAIRQAGLARIRQPIDQTWGPRVVKARAITMVACRSAPYFAGIPRPVATRGIARRPTTLEHLEATLSSLPDGLSELIVHLRAPGPVERVEARLPDLAERHAEWATLTNPRVPALFARYRIQIVGSPGDQVQPASPT